MISFRVNPTTREVEYLISAGEALTGEWASIKITDCPEQVIYFLEEKLAWYEAN